MVRFHPSFSRTKSGFIPRIMVRDNKGQMKGSATPNADAKPFRTFPTADQARIEARLIANRVAQTLTATRGIAVRVA